MSYCIERWLWLTIIVYGLHSKERGGGDSEWVQHREQLNVGGDVYQSLFFL